MWRLLTVGLAPSRPAKASAEVVVGAFVRETTNRGILAVSSTSNTIRDKRNCDVLNKE